MPVQISFDGNNVPVTPTMVLATKSGNKLGVINNISDVVLTDSMASPAELSFQVHKSMGSVACNLWNDIVDFKLIWCKEWDKWFSCEVSLSESTELVKSVTAYSLGEYELSQILLYDVEINTEDDIIRPEYTAPTVFYDPLHPDSSLLHRLLEKAPHYSINHVDTTIENIQRTFSFNGRSIKDAFDDVAEEIGCLFVYDTAGSGGTLVRGLSVYDLEQTCLTCGHRGDYTDVCPECGSTNIQYGFGDDTTIFVSADNLTEEITYQVDAGSVKNCFRLTAGDELMTATVRACNPAGGSYIWYMPDTLRQDMTPELRDKLADYDTMNAYWLTEKSYQLNQQLVSQYNTLVRKYLPRNESLTEITSPVTGYSSLMRYYYDVIDFALYLRTTMMPEILPETKTAASQAALLTVTSLSPVAVSSLSDSTSRNTAESAIKTIVRAIIDTAKYSFTVNTTAWSNPSWTGTITVTSRTEDEHGNYDTATTGSLSLTFTDDFETYLRQVIDKKMKAKDSENFNISNVLSRNIDDMVALLPRYSYDCLSGMADCCQDVLNVVIDVSGNQWANIQADIYNPYYNKLAAIQEEMNLRANEIAIISDEESYGMQQDIESIRSAVQTALDLEGYLGDELWGELCSYRREDEYKNDNYVSDGLTNAELIDNALDFINKAKKEIYKSATLQHSISATLSNLLSINAFKPIVDKFCVGNWIRVRVDGSVYRLRLLSYTVDFSSFEKIQVEFSDVTSILDGTSDVQSVLSHASSMASTFGFVQKQASSGADSKHILADWVANGLATTQARIMDSADNQNMVWDERGMLFRRYDPIMEQYDPEQLKIINSTIAVTDDNWRSTKTAVGRFFYQDPTTSQYVEAYGVNGETIVGKLILGQNLGIYNSANSMTFDRNGLAVTNGTNTVTISPASSTLFNISKGQNSIFYVDSDGSLRLTGSGVDIKVDSSSSSISLSANSFSWQATNSSMTTGGYLTVAGGEIGGFQIDSTSIHTKNVAVTSNATNSVALSSADFARTINGTSRSGLRFAIGSKFGVKNDGTVYASGGDFTGDITATTLTLTNGLTVGSGNSSVSISSSGVLNAVGASISGTIDATALNVTSSYYNIKANTVQGGVLIGGDPQDNLSAYIDIYASNMDLCSGGTLSLYGRSIFIGASGFGSVNLEGDVRINGESISSISDTYASISYVSSNYASKSHSHSEYVEVNDANIYSSLRIYDTPVVSVSGSSMYFGTNSSYGGTTNVRGDSVYIYSHSSGSVYINGQNFKSVIDDLSSRITALENKK